LRGRCSSSPLESLSSQLRKPYLGVIAFPPLLITKNFISLLYLVEFVGLLSLQGVVFDLVRMTSEGQLAISGLDLSRRGILRHSQGLIGIGW